MARRWSKVQQIHRVLKLDRRDMQKGEDVKALQAALNARARARGLPTIKVDGIFGEQSLASVTAVGRALGAAESTLAKRKATIGLQRIIRFPATRNPAQLKRAKERKQKSCSMPVARLITDTWGYHPGVHDGVDLICPPREPALAVCRCKVVRVDAAGWWGKGAPSDPAVRAKGDGVIILRSLVDSGPIRKGMNFVYGHAEGACVRVGQTVEAGQVIGEAGLANAWHIHFCVNTRTDTKGVGDRDPRPILEHLKSHSRK